MGFLFDLKHDFPWYLIAIVDGYMELKLDFPYNEGEAGKFIVNLDKMLSSTLFVGN